MAGKRTALLISAGEFTSTTISPLKGPRNDVTMLAAALADPNMGNFQVQVASDLPRHEVTKRIKRLFHDASQDDIVALYFSGHGWASNDGDLQLLLTDTNVDELNSTSLSTSLIAESAQNSQARQVAIILDCDYAHTFPDSPNTFPSIKIGDQPGGRDPEIFILSSTKESQHAYESLDEGFPAGVFTVALVEGIQTGAADLDEDGLIHLDELEAHIRNSISRRFRQSPRLRAPGKSRFLLARAPTWSVETRGYGDRPPTTDLLRRGAMLDTLVELVSIEAGTSDSDRDGPTVIALDGAWGTGKTSLITLMEERLTQLPRFTEPGKTGRHLSVFEADRALSGRQTRLWEPEMIDRAAPSAPRPPVITARFEPWAHQTDQQVWAGIAKTLLDSVTTTLLPPGSPSSERYWFQRNVERVDRMRLRRALRKSAVSPLLTVAVLALVIPIVAQLARSTDQYHLVGWIEVVGSNLAVAIVAAVFLAGIVHTVLRLRLPAATFLPSDLFTGPIVSTAFAHNSDTSDDALHDPYYNARSGFLYLLQHDVFALLHDVEKAGHTVVLFIDDLDRCSPSTTAEVFEAINIFVNRTYPVTKFVLCLDTSTVADHLDHVHSTLKDKALHGDDPSPGWSFMRKLVQLPIPIPPASPETVEEILGVLLRKPDTTAPQRRTTADRADSIGATPSTSTTTQPSEQEPRSDELEISTNFRLLEHNEQVRARIVQRLTAQPDPSIRETKRILTTWQYYVRVMLRARDLQHPPTIEDARALVVLAEIVTRWPAAQRGLNRRFDGEHGLQLLAETTGNNWEWTQALQRLGLHNSKYANCTNGLRDLLLRYDGHRVAALAAELM
ncbi:P-loop NTPase fold protein [Amycolatopsis sp. WQ 127309]|uniref:P-loop NTPase fold protein n=1 Tax=Amycolatopsis sp. WQ 127309 TaxID=2932773 RepID=UPI001FF4CC56|nr:P-loop NTPase fold protein [Amycolatopsis sp. WQ 127309]UOZ03291.1 P-loop NTPase fold protein [Amycolatopsis sp. WQ 127309]